MGKLKRFNANELKPKGWLYTQLRIQADGLSGNLDKIWPDIKDSAWIGGDREGWERLPYWLDGFIPLAYLLDDEDMKNRARKYVDAIISRQREDGWICPCADGDRGSYDIWALFLICKVLVEYYECTEDARAEKAVHDALGNLYTMLSNGELSLKNWGKFRWFECFVGISWLWKRTGETWLKELARLIKSEGADYPSFFERWKIPLNQWTFETHIVNIAMAIKAEAVSHEILGEPYTGFASDAVRVLDRYNSTAVGIWTGDECLSGISPIQGSELCSVTELMYSCECLLAETGDGSWADRLEKVAFNALPAECSEDMRTHQYLQMVNQIECVPFPGKSLFRTNGSEAHLFGLEPNYGCCTANFNQGWPKFALNTFMRSENGIVSTVFAPSELKTDIGGASVAVTLKTDYPFKDKLSYTVCAEKPVFFEFSVRIPEWSRGIRSNIPYKIENGFLYFEKSWEGEEAVELEFLRKLSLDPRPGDMRVLNYGPLVFALPVKGEWEKREYERDGVERRFPYCDYFIHRRSDWNYAFDSEIFDVFSGEIGERPFSESKPPITVRAKMRRIGWGFADGYTSVCAAYPKSRMPVGEMEEMTLIPYGCTTLRVTEMPLLP